MRTLRESEHEPVGWTFSHRVHRPRRLDRRPPRRAPLHAGVDAVLLRRPAGRSGDAQRQDFVDTNITGTLNLLEEAAAAGARAFVYTSTRARSAAR
jgi:nucleoside-diphosphate-sugar epimerase